MRSKKRSKPEIMSEANKAMKDIKRIEDLFPLSSDKYLLPELISLEQC